MGCEMEYQKNELNRAIIFCYAAGLLDILFTAIGIHYGFGTEGNLTFAWMPLWLLIPSAISRNFLIALVGLAVSEHILSEKKQAIASIIFYYIGITWLIGGAGSWYYAFRVGGVI